MVNKVNSGRCIIQGVRVWILLWFDEEAIFNKNVDREENKSLDDHGKNIASCDVPTECWSYEVLP